MLYTYTASSQTVVTNGAIALQNNALNCSCMEHPAGSTTITIRSPGIYIIDVTVNATSATTGPLSFQLYNNGVAVPAAIATNTIATENNVSNFAFTVAMRIRCSCSAIDNSAQLTIVNASGNAAIVSNAAVVIHRV